MTLRLAAIIQEMLSFFEFFEEKLNLESSQDSLSESQRGENHEEVETERMYIYEVQNDSNSISNWHIKTIFLIYTIVDDEKIEEKKREVGDEALNIAVAMMEMSLAQQSK